MGKTKLTPETLKLLVQGIKLGASFKDTAAFAGISEDTFYAWMRKGRESNRGLYRAAYLAIERAKGVGSVTLLAMIEKAAQQGDWRAAAWKLERRLPEEFGRQRVDVRHSGPNGGPMQVQGEVEHSFVVAMPAVAEGEDQWTAAVAKEQSQRAAEALRIVDASSGSPSPDPSPG